MLESVEWGEFKFKEIFDEIRQGRRLKKDDQLPGEIPFVMSGVTDTGVVNYISNPVASFPKNSITVDIFGNAFYRNYDYGAGDDTGAYWSDSKEYTKEAMLFFTAAINKALMNKFDYGDKLRSSQSLHLKMSLPTKNERPDFDFIERFIAELEAERIAELEAYLSVTGLKDYHLTPEEQKALEDYQSLKFNAFKVIDVFAVKNSGNILSRDIVENSGDSPYLCASRENNAVSSYITYDTKYLDQGNCVFIGGKTFVVTYQEKDFYSNDSHNLILYLKDKERRTKLNQLYLATCVEKSLAHKYSWGDSISNRKIQKDVVSLPSKNNQPDLSSIEPLISAVQKLVIKDVVEYADQKIAAHQQVVKAS